MVNHDSLIDTYSVWVDKLEYYKRLLEKEQEDFDKRNRELFDKIKNAQDHVDTAKQMFRDSMENLYYKDGVKNSVFGHVRMIQKLDYSEEELKQECLKKAPEVLKVDPKKIKDAIANGKVINSVRMSYKPSFVVKPMKNADFSAIIGTE